MRFGTLCMRRFLVARQVRRQVLDGEELVQRGGRRSGRPSSFCNADWTRTTRSESPPISKKFALTLMPSWPNTSDQMARICRSSSFAGRTAGSAATSTGAGKALRSILPFGVSGNCVQLDEEGGHHERRQSTFKPRTQEPAEGRLRRSPGRRHIGVPCQIVSCPSPSQVAMSDRAARRIARTRRRRSRYHRSGWAEEPIR